MGFPGDFLATPGREDTARHERPTPPAEKPKPAFSWIPIRSLSERHRPRIKSHLLALAEPDRYLRFGYAASDAQINLYVDRIDFDTDEVFGIFNRRLELIAMAHLAYLPLHPGQAAGTGAAEFGVSVAKKSRGRGFGARLFDHAVLHARNRHIEMMIIHALSENTAMLKIARNAGSSVERDGGDSEAHLKLPPENFATHVEEIVEGQAAEIDYQIKQGAQRVDALLGLFTDVRHQIEKVRARRIE